MVLRWLYVNRAVKEKVHWKGIEFRSERDKDIGLLSAWGRLFAGRSKDNAKALVAEACPARPRIS